MIKKDFATKAVKEKDGYRAHARVSMEDRNGFFALSSREVFPTEEEAKAAIKKEIMGANEWPEIKEEGLVYEFTEIPWDHVGIT